MLMFIRATNPDASWTSDCGRAAMHLASIKIWAVDGEINCTYIMHYEVNYYRWEEIKNPVQALLIMPYILPMFNSYWSVKLTWQNSIYF